MYPARPPLALRLGDPRGALRVAAPLVAPLAPLGRLVGPLALLAALAAAFDWHDLRAAAERAGRGLAFWQTLLVGLVAANGAARLGQALAMARQGAPPAEWGLHLALGVLPRIYIDAAPIRDLPAAGQRACHAAPLRVRLGLFAGGVLLWAVLGRTGSGLAAAGLVVAAVGLAAFLFTANPLWPADGYRWLAAATSRPRLRPHAFRALGLVLRLRPLPSGLGRGEAALLIGYAVASLAFTALLAFLVLSGVALALEARLAGTGVLLFGVLLAGGVAYLLSRRDRARAGPAARRAARAAAGPPPPDRRSAMAHHDRARPGRAPAGPAAPTEPAPPGERGTAGPGAPEADVPARPADPLALLLADEAVAEAAPEGAGPPRRSRAAPARLMARRSPAARAAPADATTAPTAGSGLDDLLGPDPALDPVADLGTGTRAGNEREGPGGADDLAALLAEDEDLGAPPPGTLPVDRAELRPQPESSLESVHESTLGRGPDPATAAPLDPGPPVTSAPASPATPAAPAGASAAPGRREPDAPRRAPSPVAAPAAVRPAPSAARAAPARGSADELDRLLGLGAARPTPAARVRVAVLWLAVAGVLAWVAFLPYPFEVGGEFVVQPFERAEARARTDGEVVSLNVAEGAWVEAGDVLAVLSNWEERRDVALREADVQRLRAELATLEGGATPEEIAVAEQAVAAAALRVDATARALAREEALLERGTVAATVTEDARDAHAAALAQRDEAAAALALVRADARATEVEAARAALRRSEEELAFARLMLEMTNIRAPAAGQVVSDLGAVPVGAFLAEGALLAAIEDNRTVVAEVEVPETTIGEVALGAPAELRLWSDADAPIAGAVRSIAPRAEEREFGLVIRVGVEVPNADGRLAAGMTGFGKIAAEPRPVWQAFGRALRRFLVIELWSWLP